MRWIDDQGRFAGRMNVIDAGFVVCVLALVPVGYTTFRLVRLPPPIVAAVEPVEQIVGPDLRIRLRGRDFRPALRALFGRTHEPFSLDVSVRFALNEYASITGRFVVVTPTDVEIALPRLSPGQYDVHLYDDTHEVAKRLGAFVLRSPPDQDSWARIRVRFSKVPFDPGVVRPGDVDASHETAADSGVGAPDTRSAVLRSSGAPLRSSTMTDERRSFLYSLESDIDVPVRKVIDGLWWYKGQVIRRGEPFSFETTRYVMRGVVVDMAESRTQ